MLCWKPLLECLRVLTPIILEMSLIAQGEFAGLESILPSKSLFCSRAALCSVSTAFHRPPNQGHGEDSQHPHIRRSSSSYIPAQTQPPSFQDAQDTLPNLGNQLAAQGGTLGPDQVSQFPRDGVGSAWLRQRAPSPRMRPAPQPHPPCWGVRMLHPLQLQGNSQADG